MTDENIVPFEPRPKEAPALRFPDIYMDPETLSHEWTLYDDDNNVVAQLSYDLVYVTPGFDLNRYREFWHRHRGGTAAAS